MGPKVDRNCACAEKGWEHVRICGGTRVRFHTGLQFSDLIEMAQNTVIHFDFKKSIQLFSSCYIRSYRRADGTILRHTAQGFSQLYNE
jgi:hypothetical protein